MFVESLTMLIGRESAHIVVAEALRMNGALIANADRSEDGQFTDHGNLTLKVGELFVQHIYCYGKTPMQTFQDSKKLALEKNNEILYLGYMSDSQNLTDNQV